MTKLFFRIGVSWDNFMVQYPLLSTLLQINVLRLKAFILSLFLFSLFYHSGNIIKKFGRKLNKICFCRMNRNKDYEFVSFILWEILKIDYFMNSRLGCNNLLLTFCAKISTETLYILNSKPYVDNERWC